MSKRYNCFCACIATLLMFTEISTHAAVVATFEGYVEGSLGNSFTESHSGIVFTNGTFSLGGGVFIAEFGNYDPPYNFPMFPGNILTVAASSPGPNVGLGGRAGFTATFPFATSSVEMDVIYSSSEAPASVTITGFSNTNQQVTQTTYALQESNFTYVHEVFIAPSPIQKIVIVPTGISAALGYDNVSIPISEPSTFALALAIGLCIPLRRRSQVARL